MNIILETQKASATMLQRKL
ncbi:MAG: hypothetical protein ACOZBL_00315 [Patescibacteria group bacterium]